jgi:hypothetical protein
MRSEFFYGLSGDGVETTLHEWSRGWEVKAFGQDSDGFWLLLVASD